MHMKKLLFSLLGLLSLLPAAAQWKWHNPVEAAYPVVQNQAFAHEIGPSYVRLPDRAHGVVSENVWNLSRNSAGLALHFYSNASQIRVRYTVAGGYSMPHMPATGVSGVDLYRIDSDGAWQFCFGNYAFQDTISYTTTVSNGWKSVFRKQKMRHLNGFLFLPSFPLSYMEPLSLRELVPHVRLWRGVVSCSVRWIIR